MQITDLLDKKSIYLGAKVSSKEETLDRAVALMAESGKIADVETCTRGRRNNRNRRRNRDSAL